MLLLLFVDSLLTNCETPECGMDFFFISHQRILWIDARGISNMLDVPKS